MAARPRSSSSCCLRTWLSPYPPISPDALAPPLTIYSTQLPSHPRLHFGRRSCPPSLIPRTFRGRSPLHLSRRLRPRLSFLRVFSWVARLSRCRCLYHLRSCLRPCSAIKVFQFFGCRFCRGSPSRICRQRKSSHRRPLQIL
jgi:hypothetical protein